MGNRERLLSAALDCLVEKGYARTTARDIAGKAEVSLAAIGYHFGTKDKLLQEALFAATAQWGDDLQAVLAGTLPPSLDRFERFERAWEGVLKSFETNRAFWVASFELVAQVDHVPEIRDAFAQVQDDARRGLASLFTGVAETSEEAATIGAFCHPLLTGMMAMWLIDPEGVPTAKQLTDALRLITGA